LTDLPGNDRLLGKVTYLTYNFDPDRWYENELAALELAYQTGQLDQAAFEKRKDKLMARYDDMLERLDGTYRVDHR
jgi:hypothetical protein